MTLNGEKISMNANTEIRTWGENVVLQLREAAAVGVGHDKFRFWSRVQSINMKLSCCFYLD